MHLPAFFLALSLLSITHALPANIRRSERIFIRQNAGGITGPTTVHTKQTSNTVVGAMTQDCVITFTPITDNQGQPAVQEVESCTISMDQNNGSDSGGSPPSDGSSNSGGSSTSGDSSNSGGSSNGTSASTGTTSAGSPPAGAAVSVNGVSSVPAPAATSPAASASSSGTTTFPTAASSTSSSTTTFPTAPAPTGQAVSVDGESSVPAPAVSNGAATTSPQSASASALSATAAAAQASTTAQATFTLPGKKLSVLPIGLGVFAGISVIALVVVGLVTYERTKYRKAFRQRKLAEAGAGMGVGGMARP